jgi:hypothetical protein
MRADPGIGREAAPIGSVEWAQHVRLHFQAAMKRLEEAPERVQSFVDQVIQHRAWTLMSKPDGSFFATWDEFCASPQPYGLGKPWDEFRPLLEAANGKKAVQLGTVADPQVHAGPGRGHKGEEKTNCDGRNSFPDREKASRVRAILRAPEQVRDLYRADLIGQKEAAKLGPKNPTPEEAAKVTEVAIAVTDVVKTAPRPESPRAKRDIQRKVNMKVREMVGSGPDPVRRLARDVRELTGDQRRSFFGELVIAYPREISWAR